jgi:DNA segregation ATPase FtsK/SpoIIIE, S-DNA-T family
MPEAEATAEAEAMAEPEAMPEAEATAEPEATPEAEAMAEPEALKPNDERLTAEAGIFLIYVLIIFID